MTMRYQILIYRSKCHKASHEYKRNKCRDGGGSIGAEELGQVCSNKKNRIQRTIQVKPIPISLF